MSSVYYSINGIILSIFLIKFGVNLVLGLIVAFIIWHLFLSKGAPNTKMFRTNKTIAIKLNQSKINYFEFFSFLLSLFTKVLLKLDFHFHFCHIQLGVTFFILHGHNEGRSYLKFQTINFSLNPCIKRRQNISAGT